MLRDKLLYGVGTNDAEYVVKRYKEESSINGRRNRTTVWQCPFYTRWKSMLQRGFSDKFKVAHPCYEDVSVCNEWLTFSTFRSWMSNQNWEGLHLDKDILFKENKVYCPEKCCFVPRYINNLLTNIDTKGGDYPIGVSYRKPTLGMVNEISTPYVVDVKSSGKKKYIGSFSQVHLAHQAWQTAKASEIEAVIYRYSKEAYFSTIVADALMSRVWKLRLDCLNGVSTDSL